MRPVRTVEEALACLADPTPPLAWHTPEPRPPEEPPFEWPLGGVSAAEAATRMRQLGEAFPSAAELVPRRGRHFERHPWERRIVRLGERLPSPNQGGPHVP